MPSGSAGIGHAAAVTNWGEVVRRAARTGLDLLVGRSRTAPTRRSDGPGGPATRRAAPAPRYAPTRERSRTVVYAPDLDGAADPGEIVWTWVPFEEGDGRGKDRPLLVVGREGGELLGLMLSSSRQREGDRDWVSVGAGDWDGRGRESFVRLDRVLEVGEHDIRREGAVLDRDRFDRVARELRTRGWS